MSFSMDWLQSWLGLDRFLVLPLALGFALVLALLTRFVFRSLGERFQRGVLRSGSVGDEVLSRVFSGTQVLVLWVWYFFLLARALPEGARFQPWLSGGTILATMIQSGIWGMGLIDAWSERTLVRRTRTDPSSTAALSLLRRAVQTAFLSTLVLFGLGNLGVNIGALIAGLGVGGIAVALAAQNILGDLLASLSIVFDKPFSVGDFIASGAEKGTVESIGIKTTRIRSVSGEQIILSNKDLLESRVRNFGRRVERKVEHRLGIDAATSASRIERIPQWVQDVFRSEPKATLERCHLTRLGESALEVELCFSVPGADTEPYLDLQHRLLLGILRKLEDEKVSLASTARAIPARLP